MVVRKQEAETSVWITFIDDYSCFKAVYLLKHKSEAFAAFKQFKAWAENVTGERLDSRTA
jgi:hypothetical protein